jgi:ribonuclease-3
VLEKELQCKFPNSELLQIAMFQPSTRNLFTEIRVHFRDSHNQPVNREDYENLEALSDMGEVLAMLGDAAISMAVLHHLWRERTADAGEITQERASLVSNENMSRLCDRWGLYQMRIHFDPKTSTKSEMEHIKGTLLEAVYGILYIDEGFEKIINAVQLLR